MQESDKNKGLDQTLNSTLFKFPTLKHTQRDVLNAKAKEIARKIKAYDYTGAHPKILERIEEIHRLLEWYQEGHSKNLLEKEFGVKEGQLANYIFEMLGKADEKQTPARDIIIELASRDVQGTRHDYAGLATDKSNLKHHVRFLDKLEAALERTDLPPKTRNKLSAMKEYAFASAESCVEEITVTHATSRPSIYAWIQRWNERTAGDPEKFFVKDWTTYKDQL